MTQETTNQTDVVVVGAGFAGLYMVHRLVGDGWRVQGYEAGDGAGGTWYWNRYPGARCDVESLEYSYGFDDVLQLEWEWTERYASQPEILRYLEHVADRFDLRRHFCFGTRVASASFDDTVNRWTVRTDGGEEITAQFVIMATGCLSSANIPDIAGTEEFNGEVLHTGRWPHKPRSFAGKRVGIIGTGSSAIQAAPVIAAEADELYVFQRTATYSVPARNRPLDPAEVAEVKSDYSGLRTRNRDRAVGFGSRSAMPEFSALEVEADVRELEYEERWQRGGFGFLGAYTDLALDKAANDTAADFVRAKIRQTVTDAETAERLAPKQVIGCKRLCFDTGYYEMFNRPNVHLVDLTETPLERLTAAGIECSDRHHDLDTIVFATGFDAMTGALAAIDIRGRNGVALRDVWSAGPRTYLGLGVPQIPNLFVITGPGSPSVLTNMVTSIEHHVEWISECLDHLRTAGRASIEATEDAATKWVEYVNAVASFTLFPTCNSWYLGANVPGKPRVFMPLPGLPPYIEQCTMVAERGYEGFEVR